MSHINIGPHIQLCRYLSRVSFVLLRKKTNKSCDENTDGRWQRTEIVFLQEITQIYPRANTKHEYKMLMNNDHAFSNAVIMSGVAD